MDAWDYPILPLLDGDIEIALSLPQVFKSPGGKHLVAKKIASLLPSGTTYVEPFCGSAAVFFAKDPSPREVLSDLREGLIDTFRFIRDATPDDFEKLFKQNWRPSRKRWEFLTKWKPRSLLGKAYRFLWLSRASLLNREGENYSPVMARRNMRVPLKSRFPKWQARLQGVTLLKQDAFKVIPRYDSKFTVYYLDPPYPKGRHPNLYPNHEFEMKDLNRLCSLLKGLDGKFIMSLNLASLPKMPSYWRVQRLKILYPGLPTSVPHLKLSRPFAYRYEALVFNF